MHRRIGLLVGATTSAVVFAFVIPLCLLVRNMAHDRAVADANQQARNIAILVSSLHGDATLPGVVGAVDQRSPATTTVVLPNGATLGNGSVRPTDPDVLRARSGVAFTHETAQGFRSVVPVLTSDGTDVVVTEVTTAQLQQGVAAAWGAIIGLGVMLLALASLVAIRMGRRISTPVTRVAEVADRLREGDLGARAPLEGPAETQALAEALNRLAERISELLVAERAAVGDLSHRLRTPVTALRIDVEGVTDATLAERLREHVGTLQRSIDAIVAEARRPVRHDMTSTCDASAVVRERVAYWAPLAEDQGRDLSVEITDEPAPVHLDPVDLRDVVDVLIDNVFAHTAEGVAFAVSVQPEGDTAIRVVVSDRGAGLSSTTPGASRPGHTGLGLEIARRTITSAGGALDIDAGPDGGTRVTIRLPLAHWS